MLHIVHGGLKIVKALINRSESVRKADREFPIAIGRIEVERAIVHLDNNRTIRKDAHSVTLSPVDLLGIADLTYKSSRFWLLCVRSASGPQPSTIA